MQGLGRQVPRPPTGTAGTVGKGGLWELQAHPRHGHYPPLSAAGRARQGGVTLGNILPFTGAFTGNPPLQGTMSPRGDIYTPLTFQQALAYFQSRNCNVLAWHPEHSEAQVLGSIPGRHS